MTAGGVYVYIPVYIYVCVYIRTHKCISNVCEAECILVQKISQKLRDVCKLD